MYFHARTYGGRKIENVFLPGDKEHYESLLRLTYIRTQRPDFYYGKQPRQVYSMEDLDQYEVDPDNEADILDLIRTLFGGGSITWLRKSES